MQIYILIKLYKAEFFCFVHGNEFDACNFSRMFRKICSSLTVYYFVSNNFKIFFIRNKIKR